MCLEPFFFSPTIKGRFQESESFISVAEPSLIKGLDSAHQAPGNRQAGLKGMFTLVTQPGFQGLD